MYLLSNFQQRIFGSVSISLKGFDVLCTTIVQCMLRNKFSRTRQSQGLFYKHGHDSFTTSVSKPSPPHSNSFIYQAASPSRVFDSPVSAENVIFEAFVLMGELGWSFSSLLQKRRKKSEDKSSCHPSSFSILPLSSRKAVKEAPANFPQKKSS